MASNDELWGGNLMDVCLLVCGCREFSMEECDAAAESSVEPRCADEDR